MSELKKVPELRFPEFGENWSTYILGKLAKITSGGTPNRSNSTYWSGDIPWITTSLINSNEISHAEEFISEEGLKNSSAKMFPKGTVLMAMYGQGKTRGKVAILQIEATTNQACAAIIPQTNIDNQFLFQRLSGMYERIRGESNEGGQKNLSGQLIKNLTIGITTLPEQQKIASFLTAVDTKIEQLNQKKALLEQYKKGAMQKLFSQELRFKDANGKDYPDWEVKKIGKVLTIGSGRDYKHLHEGEIPVYGTGGLMTKVDEFLFDGESVGIGRKGTIDKPVFLTGKFWTVDTLFYTHTFIKCLPIFVFYVFNTINWKRYNEASGVPSLSKNTIAKIKIGSPSLEEQAKIANFLSAIDAKIELVNTQLENAQQFKKGLLQKMFV